jgi:hypothetical protein
MAINYYQGTTGTWLDADWSDNIPIDADQCYFVQKAHINVAGTDQSGIKVALFRTNEDWTGSLGSSGDPIIIDATLVEHFGTGTLYYKSDDAGSTEYTDWVFINSPNQELAAHLDGEKIDRITVIQGKVTVAGTLGTVAAPTLIEVGWNENPASDANVTVNSLDASTGVLRMAGGRVTTGTAIPRCDIAGGRLVHNNVGAITELNLFGEGARCEYNSESTLPVVNLVEGILDLTKGSVAKTVTTINLFAKGELIYDPSLMVSDPTINQLGKAGKITKKAS